jgi:uncharacterized membrane protein required for colicin V production
VVGSVAERGRWTLASIIMAFLVSAYFSDHLAQLFDALLAPAEALIPAASASGTLKLLQDTFLAVYALLRGVLTSRLGLTALMGLGLVLMAFRVRREPGF